MAPENGALTRDELDEALKSALANVASKEDILALEYDINQLKQDVSYIKGDISSLKASYQSLSKSHSHLSNQVEESSRRNPT